MNLPSFRTLLDAATVTLRRFPFVLLCSAGAAVAVICEVDEPRGIAVLGLGISLLFAVATIAERRAQKVGTTALASLAGVGLLLLYFFLLPTGDLPLPEAIRLALIFLSTHLLCAFGPFVGRGHGDGFWKYNQTLFLRALTAALFSLTLYAGLGLAVLAADKLLGFEPYENIYLDLFALIAGVFNTWFFLAGVPRDVAALAEATDYPKGLKIFSQYVLIPLVAIYAVILYLYSAKILLSWTWPIGWTSMPVFVFSVAGILAFLLLYPIRERAEERWVATYARWFFYLLLPLTALPVLAMWRRIGEYGITEERYLGLILALWLACLAVFMILTRQRSIRAIPVSLCVAALLATYGPWSATSVTIASQTARLEQLLSTSGLLSNGSISPTAPAPNPTDADEIRDLIWFLGERDGLGEVRGWFGKEGERLTAEQIRWKLGVERASEYDSLGTARAPRPFWKLMGVESHNSGTPLVDVAGFKFYLRIEGGREKQQTPLGVVALDRERGVISFTTTAGEVVELNIAERALQLADTVISGSLPEATGRRDDLYDHSVQLWLENKSYTLHGQGAQAPLVMPLLVMEGSVGGRTIRCILRSLHASISPEGRQATVSSATMDVLLR